MNIKIVNKSKQELPSYSMNASAGMDLRANTGNGIILKPLQRTLLPTGLFIDVRPGFEAQVRPGSGLAIKKGTTILNSQGTIDSDYRGEVCIIMISLSDEIFVIKYSERIYQMVTARHEKAEWKSLNTLIEAKKGTGGFGHTGKK